MNTTGPASTTSVVPKVHVKSVPQCTKDVQSEPIASTQESPNNNKGNSSVLGQCVPTPPKCKSGGKS